jgi:hypothetical protein
MQGLGDLVLKLERLEREVGGRTICVYIHINMYKDIECKRQPDRTVYRDI